MSDINKEKHYKIIRRRPWGWYMRNKVFYFDSGCILNDPREIELFEVHPPHGRMPYN
jgi:hypothetical protein